MRHHFNFLRDAMARAGHGPPKWYGEEGEPRWVNFHVEFWKQTDRVLNWQRIPELEIILDHGIEARLRDD